MADVKQFNLPDVGEGLTEAEIVSWKVKPGDSIKVNDVIVEIETAKSLVELPSPFSGVVADLLVPEGETVPVGTPIIAVQTEGAAAAGAAPESEAEEAPAEERQSVLVGYGPRTGAARRRARKAPAATAPAVPVQPAVAEPGPPEPAPVDGAPPRRAPVEERPAPALAEVKVLAKPPVRKLAKDLGVDLRTVTPTGPGGTITRTDVEAAARQAAKPAAAPVEAAVGLTAWDGGPREERVPIRSVRKATAAAVSQSAFTAPHVTEFITFDATGTMELLDRLRQSREFRDVKLSPLTVLAKAMCVAVRRTPEVNARWDEEAGEIVFQRYVNLGIAAATPRGLVVPNIKDAHRLDLRSLAIAINELAATAREGKTPPQDMVGGTISITNVGVFGVDTGTPILPPGESAIMALGAIKKQPWVHEDEVKPRWVTTLGLSFDHRLVDGEQGSRFLADVARLMEDPAQALVWA